MIVVLVINGAMMKLDGLFGNDDWVIGPLSDGKVGTSIATVYPHLLSKFRVYLYVFMPV